MPSSTYTYTHSNYRLPKSTSISSTGFRDHVTKLLADLTRCLELCESILNNRRLGSTHKSFDRLQEGLKSSASEIQNLFNVLRRAIGPKMDQGDDKACSAMEIAVRDTQMEIRAKLFDIAYKRRETGDAPESPGFRYLLRRWKLVEQEAIDTLQGLGQRLGERMNEKAKVAERIDQEEAERVTKEEAETTAEDEDGNADEDAGKSKKTHGQKPKTSSRDSSTYRIKSAYQSSDDERKDNKDTENEVVTIRLKDLDQLLNHMKNSWVEKRVAGSILYINKFDAEKTQWERPKGYIKPLRPTVKYSNTPYTSTSYSSSPPSLRHSSTASWDSRRSSEEATMPQYCDARTDSSSWSWEQRPGKTCTRSPSRSTEDSWSDPSGW